MAFESSSKRYKCGECNEAFTYFQLMENSRRDKTEDKIDEITGENSRVCTNCELKLRQKEWDRMSDDFKLANPIYATVKGVRRDQKMKNKGTLWNAQAEHIAQAEKEILKEAEGWEDVSRQKKMKAILQRATKLAQALLNAIVNGNFINAFSAAGKRMERDNEVGEEYIKAYGAAMANEDNKELQTRLDKLEPKVAQTMDYETCKDFGDKQAAMLRALDFVDAFSQGLRLYNVCRAKTRNDEKTNTHCSCGLAFPSKMWTQPDPGRW